MQTQLILTFMNERGIRMKKTFGHLSIERNGKVIWQKQFKGRATMTEAYNYIDSLGLCAVEYTCCANGNKILLAMAEDEL